MSEISIIGVWLGIKKRIGFILFFTTVVVFVVLASSIFIVEPEYMTRATLIVGRPASYSSSQTLEYNDILLSQKLVGTYSELMKSDIIMRQVNDNLGLSMTKNQLSQKIDVQTVSNTEIISITVIDKIPERAMDIANETAIIFMDEVRAIMKVDNVQLLDAATLPEEAKSPNLPLNLVASLLIGVILSTSIAIFGEFTDTRVKSVEDYKNAFDIPVIGIIPLAKGE